MAVAGRTGPAGCGRRHRVAHRAGAHHHDVSEGPDRNRAFGVFAAVSAGGGAIGLLAGGMLTEWLDWRWVFFVNVPIGAAIILLAPSARRTRAGGTD